MTPKATVYRLDPDAQTALAQLSKLLGRPMNKLVNEAVRDYLQRTTARERDIEGTLASLRAYRERDLPVREASATYPVEVESDAIRAAREFARRVSARYDVKAVLLFGSCARSTHRPDSDVDLAVVLRASRGKLMDVSLEMSDIAFELLLETNVYIAPLPVRDEEWDHPETHPNPRLLENIRIEGRPL
jgi:predicted nucleotidyltransferase/predicted transcriptional regulator